jgi:hypothetical protein
MISHTPKSILSHWLWNDNPYPKLQGYLDLRFAICHSATEVLFNNCRYMLSENEIITSDYILAKRWGWSRNKVRKFLEQLEHESLIVCDRNKTRTIITVFPDNLPLKDKIQGEVAAEIQEKDSQKAQEKGHLNTSPTRGLSNVEVPLKEQEKAHQEEQVVREERVLKNLFSDTADAELVGNPDPNTNQNNDSLDKSPLIENTVRAVGEKALKKNYTLSFPNENK